MQGRRKPQKRRVVARDDKVVDGGYPNSGRGVVDGGYATDTLPLKSTKITKSSILTDFQLVRFMQLIKDNWSDSCS